MDALECIYNRRTVRKYKADPISKEMIGKLLEAGTLAPSSGNLQNWRFILIREDAKRKVLAEACHEQYWMLSAPLYIAIANRLENTRRFYGKRGEELYSIMNVSMAAENIMLAATAMGLGSAFVAAFDQERVDQLLSVKPNVHIHGIITIGHPDEKTQMPPKLPLYATAFFDKYGWRFEDVDESLGEYGSIHKRHIGELSKIAEKINKKVEDQSQGVFDKIKKKIKDYKA